MGGSSNRALPHSLIRCTPEMETGITQTAWTIRVTVWRTMTTDRKIKRISVPTIQRDGRAVTVLAECDDGEALTLLVKTDDLRSVIDALLTGLEAADVTASVRTDDDEGGEEVRPTPIVYHAIGAGFVRDPQGGLQYILVSAATGEYIVIGFEPYRLRHLLDQIEDIESIQTSLPDDPAN